MFQQIIVLYVWTRIKPSTSDWTDGQKLVLWSVFLLLLPSETNWHVFMSARLWNPHREQTSRVEPWTGPSHEVSSASHQTAPEPEQSRNFTNCLFIYCKFKKLKWNQTLKHSSVCPQSLRHQHDDISFIINDLKTKFTSCLLQFGCLLLLILWIVTMTAQQFPLLQENCHYCCHFGVLWHHSWSTNQTSSPDGNLDWCRTPEHDSSFTPGTRLRRRWKRFSSSVLLGSADDQKSSQWAAVSGAVGRCGSGHGEARARPGDDGGRGLCTCTGPVWAGPEGTGSVRAGTSFQLQPGAPDPQLTDASTWSWQRRRNVTT